MLLEDPFGKRSVGFVDSTIVKRESQVNETEGRVVSIPESKDLGTDEG